MNRRARLRSSKFYFEKQVLGPFCQPLPCTGDSSSFGLILTGNFQLAPTHPSSRISDLCGHWA